MLSVKAKSLGILRGLHADRIFPVHFTNHRARDAESQAETHCYPLFRRNLKRIGSPLMPDTKKIVDKAWSFANVLCDDGLSYTAYTEQITFLLFLKNGQRPVEASVQPQKPSYPND